MSNGDREWVLVGTFLSLARISLHTLPRFLMSARSFINVDSLSSPSSCAWLAL